MKQVQTLNVFIRCDYLFFCWCHRDAALLSVVIVVAYFVVFTAAFRRSICNEEKSKETMLQHLLQAFSLNEHTEQPDVDKNSMEVTTHSVEMFWQNRLGVLSSR